LNPLRITKKNTFPEISGGGLSPKAHPLDTALAVTDFLILVCLLVVELM